MDSVSGHTSNWSEWEGSTRLLLWRELCRYNKSNRSPVVHGAHRAWRCPALHYTTLHYTTLHYTTLHYTTLHYTTLHYIFNISDWKTTAGRPPLQGQQTVRHELPWALGHVTRSSKKSFHNSALQSSAGENPATWIPNDDCCIPWEFCSTWDMCRATNYSRLSIFWEPCHTFFIECMCRKRQPAVQGGLHCWVRSQQSRC